MPSASEPRSPQDSKNVLANMAVLKHKIRRFLYQVSNHRHPRAVFRSHLSVTKMISLMLQLYDDLLRTHPGVGLQAARCQL